jgi:23S rRNA pseudouridine1911/1915/1917 synthase
VSKSNLAKQIEYIYEDDDIVVVSKPSGLLSIQDRYKDDTENLKAILLQKYEQVFTVHRLDKETSGIICFAKNEETHKILNQQFANREVKKIYWALVQGKPMIEEGLIDMPILNDMKNTGKMYPHKDGKPAETMFRLLNSFGNISLMEFFPLTGRTHQIRVHSKYIGCPLLVDALYGNSTEFFLSSIKKKFNQSRFEEEKPIISRLTLHAKSIEFTHPNGKKVFFESSLPKDMNALINQLSKNI